MTNGLDTTAIKILTWIVYALIFVISGSTAYLIVENAKMSDRYVRLERYQADTNRIESAACRLESKLETFSDRMENKLDVLILRGAKD